jgi:1-acyl-sn-glycerol-3-phosphate acyltransferase
VTNAIAYPRRRVARGLTRLAGRLVLPLAFRLEIAGRDRFPEDGPLIVVGNHVAAMESALMAVFTPWQVEMLGASDIPHEAVSAFFMGFYGCIPVNRGHFDRRALHGALDVLGQGGVLGIFAEGGIWEPGAARPQTGVAWLSHRTRAPVLPIGFGGTLGALKQASRLKRPRLTIRVGALIPAARIPPGKGRKPALEAYAGQVMAAVRALLPAEDAALHLAVVDERFELRVSARRPDGSQQPWPPELAIQHDTALAKFLHRPAVLKIFDQNLRLPVAPLQHLEQVREPSDIAAAVEAVLAYLADENPYLLTYRFGPREGEAMRLGLAELLALAQWADQAGLSLVVTPVRRYYSPERGQEVVETTQGQFTGWM